LGDTDLTAITACEAARRMARGELTALELTKACLARISAREGEVQAWTFLAAEHALAQARAADAWREVGKGVGPLHGIPVGIKDILDTADMPTEHGSAFFQGRQPGKDATCVAALRAAGAIILGKTVTTELATLTPNKTRNPRNLEHTPGGSSSGSAAAVADGMVPLAVGTQTKGSVIRPAAFCGVYGFKPSFGLISRTGVLAQSPSLDTVGVMGRSVEDVAAFADVLQTYDEHDVASIAMGRSNLYATATQEWPLPPLFAFVKTSAWGDASAATREAFGRLVEQLGGQAREIAVDITFAQGTAAAQIVQDVEMAAHYGSILDRAPDMISKSLAAGIEHGRRVRGVDYLAALAARKTHEDTLRQVFGDYGAILTPAAPGVAPKGLGRTGDPIFCGFWTYLGVPAITLPLLQADGMPMGVQLVGPRRDDGRLLRTARWLVQHLRAAP
jgi:Asp-tRNA(Asn)/Glu-tRNA(Gln) amidotransferase A subunit family amidase